VGQTGIEASMEEQLRGTKGSALVVVNSEERIVSEISSRPPITGNNVTLTIDSDLQKAVTDALQDGVNKAGSQAGVAIVMRVNDGQILSMVSLPSYDNNLFSAGISQTDFDRLNTDPRLPMFNRAVGGAYPPGSTYKMITASAALQEGVVTPGTTFYCPGIIYVPYTWDESRRNPYRDWKPQGHGTINIVDALKVSSDVFFYIVAGPHQQDRRIVRDDGTEQILWLRYYTPGARQPIEFNGLGIDRLDRYARAFGFGQKTGIDLPGENPGLAPNPDWKIKTFPGNNWSLGDTLLTAIGQGYTLVTPLQLVNATAAVANGGTLYRPQLVYRVTDWAGNVVQDYQPQVLGRVPVSPENLAVVREGMRQAVADKQRGTAYRLTISSVSVAGKTGTAEYGDPIAIKNGKEVRRAHAWFVAFAPYEKPEIALVVLLEGGNESLEGSTYAVPVADAILKAYFKVDK
jgi:penicillin-binding protein 2